MDGNELGGPLEEVMAIKDVPKHMCGRPTCRKRFATAHGLRVHEYRMHNLAFRRKVNARKAKATELSLDGDTTTFEPEPEMIIPTLRHCPHCGENLTGWKYQ